MNIHKQKAADKRNSSVNIGKISVFLAQYNMHEKEGPKSLEALSILK